MLVLVLGLIVISVDPALVLFGMFVAYALSGYVLWISRFKSAARRSEAVPRAPLPSAPTLRLYCRP